MKRLFVPIICSYLALFSCAGQKNIEPALADSELSAELTVLKLDYKAMDLNRVKVEARLELLNNGNIDISKAELSFVCTYLYEGLPGILHKGSINLLENAPLKPGLVSGEAKHFDLSFELPLPSANEALLPVIIDAELSCIAIDSKEFSKSIKLPLDITRIQAPILQVKQILIIKDELINTKLSLGLNIKNPNAFPVSLQAIDYKLYGEDRYWASGSIKEEILVPPFVSTETKLFLTMNFGDMNRSLLDKVVQQASVRYRLEGIAKIETGHSFLSEFLLPFDLSGKTEVIK